MGRAAVGAGPQVPQHGALEHGLVEVVAAVLTGFPANTGREWAWQWVFPATRIYGEGRGPARRDPKACHVSRLASLVRHAPSRGGPRHPHGTRAPRPPRRPRDADLHPCPQPGAGRSPKPRRPARPVITPLARRQVQRGKPYILELLSKSGLGSGMGAKALPDNVNRGGGPRLVARISRKDRSVRRATWCQDTYS